MRAGVAQAERVKMPNKTYIVTNRLCTAEDTNITARAENHEFASVDRRFIQVNVQQFE